MDLKSSSDIHSAALDHQQMDMSSPLMRAIDRKAKTCLKALQRSFSSTAALAVRTGNPSILVDDDDPSTMTIQFLHARLQSQRAEYRAEKQRALMLAKKVEELEHRLNFEEQLRCRKPHELHQDAIFTKWDNGSSSSSSSPSSEYEHPSYYAGHISKVHRPTRKAQFGSSKGKEPYYRGEICIISDEAEPELEHTDCLNYGDPQQLRPLTHNRISSNQFSRQHGATWQSFTHSCASPECFKKNKMLQFKITEEDFERHTMIPPRPKNAEQHCHERTRRKQYRLPLLKQNCKCQLKDLGIDIDLNDEHIHEYIQEQDTEQRISCWDNQTAKICLQNQADPTGAASVSKGIAKLYTNGKGKGKLYIDAPSKSLSSLDYSHDVIHHECNECVYDTVIRSTDPLKNSYSNSH